MLSISEIVAKTEKMCIRDSSKRIPAFSFQSRTRPG